MIGSWGVVLYSKQYTGLPNKRCLYDIRVEVGAMAEDLGVRRPIKRRGWKLVVHVVPIDSDRRGGK